MSDLEKMATKIRTVQDASILSNPNALNSIISAMADFFSQVFVLTTPSLVRRCDWPQPQNLNRVQLREARDRYHRHLEVLEMNSDRFGTVLVSDFPHKTTPRQIEILTDLLRVVRHVDCIKSMCFSLLDEARDDYREEIDENETDLQWIKHVNSPEYIRNVDVSFYALAFPNSPYFEEIAFATSSVKRGVVKLPAIASALHAHMTSLASKWIWKIDAAVCRMHDLDGDAPSDEMDDLVEKLSDAIARRHCLLHQPRDASPTESDTALTPKSLQCLADSKFRENNRQAFQSRVKHSDALKRVLVLCRKDAATDSEGRAVVASHADEMRELLADPPQELGEGLSRKRRQSFNFALLMRMFDVDCLDERCRIASEWKRAHGEWCERQIEFAISFIWRTDFSNSLTYLNVATCKNDEFKGSVPLPPNPCAYEQTSWFLNPPDYRKRSGLSETGMRIVCLCSIFASFLQSNETIKYGICCKRVVRTAVRRMVHHCNYTLEVVETEKQVHNTGTDIALFEWDMNDPSSEVYEKMYAPMCALSNFSAAQMNCVFGTGEVMLVLRHLLTERTRRLLPAKLIPESYWMCSDDALTILLPVINSWRQRQCIFAYAPSNPMRDVLLSVPAIRRWKPHDGQAVVYLDDFKNAFRGVREYLEFLCGQPSRMVERLHTGKNTRIGFKFDSLQLWRILQSVPIPSRPE